MSHTHTNNPDHHIHGHQGHEHNHNFSSANEAFFNDQAETYDNKPQAQEFARRISKAVRETYPSLWDEDQTTLLDYACGPGLTSRELCPYVKSVVGVDISQGMVDRYNLRVANQGIPPEEMKAVKVELKGDGTELDGAKFDIIICIAGYHHFASVDETTRILSSFLKPGGSLLIADVFNDGSGKEPMGDFGHVAPHTAGFTEEEMKKLVEGAGLEDFKFTIAIPDARMLDNKLQIFLAKAVRPGI